MYCFDQSITRFSTKMRLSWDMAGIIQRWICLECLELTVILHIETMMWRQQLQAFEQRKRWQLKKYGPKGESSYMNPTQKLMFLFFDMQILHNRNLFIQIICSVATHLQLCKCWHSLPQVDFGQKIFRNLTTKNPNFHDR